MSATDPWIDIHTHGIPEYPTLGVINRFPVQGIPSGHHPGVFFSIGLHPWYVGEHELIPEHLADMLVEPGVIAVGECGLDVFAGAPMESQERMFRMQIAVSEALQKPVIVHCVRAYSELIRIRKDMRAQQPWILHGFNANREILAQCLRHGMYFSLGPAVLLKTQKARLPEVPLSNLFFETDDSKLPIAGIYEAYNHAVPLGMDQLKNAVAQNFNAVFPFLKKELIRLPGNVKKYPGKPHE